MDEDCVPAVSAMSASDAVLSTSPSGEVSELAAVAPDGVMLAAIAAGGEALNPLGWWAKQTTDNLWKFPLFSYLGKQLG